MQIKTVQIHAPTTTTDEELFKKYIEYVDAHNNVSLVKLDEYYFIIKALGRKDYKEIMSNTQLNAYQKEEVVCEIAALYPEHFDFGLCDAGIPEQLCKEILKFSHFIGDGKETIALMDFYRSEMIQLHNQINCLISEAFPYLDFDDIENWDMEKTLKYLSRSEWILQNLRGVEMSYDPFTGERWDTSEITAPSEMPQQTASKDPNPIKQNDSPKQTDESVKGFIPGETIDERIARVESGKIKKERLTPEKLRELQSRFPEVDWTKQHKIDDFKAEISSEPVALRAPGE